MPEQSVPAIVVDGVSKTFALPHERVHTLKEKALHPLRRSSHETLRALRDVSFAVPKGEFFGIVGRNGSGKSTLLKCLAGIYATDAGRIYVNGRVSTFIELGVGFNPDLPARDNVKINATMLGLTPREADRRFDRIVDFAELHDFVDLKLKNYSSGMLVRLAFSVMIQVDAEILLIDEVLAVGDAAFSQKCFDEFGRIRRSGATVLLVTHDMSAVQRFCDRAMVMENGKVVQIGDVDAVADKYLQLNFSEEARAEVAGEEGPVTVVAGEGETVRAAGDGHAEILEAWVEDGNGGRLEVAPTGSPTAVCFRVRFHEDVQDPVFGVGLDDSQGNGLFSATSAFDGPSGRFPAGTEHIVHVSFQNFLGPERYAISASVAPDGNGLRFHDKRDRIARFAVTDGRPRASMTALPYHVDVVPAQAHQEVAP
ncbi:MAG TPA: ABC transporter ATP-binding protein [Baekduia sp.]|nr:ABC transporter ATP-binding protein [Baekduia sp.]